MNDNIYEIKNFLDEDLADKIRLSASANFKAGRCLFKSYPFAPNTDQTEAGYRNTPENQEKIRISKKYALENYKKKGDFTRSYYLLDKCENMAKAEVIMRSKETKERLEKITGFKNLSIYAANFFLYDKGCFISEHYDMPDPNLVLTTVLYLTKNWQNSYGGLYLYNMENPKEIKIYCPQYNSMLVSNINKEAKHLHGVSVVKEDVHRLTMVCSWQTKNTENFNENFFHKRF